ncbi:MAG: zinc ribbon domain-containing protein [Sedimentisphaerales bacterium]|nr:zinc ribbon domain-containing protein [Sedimentisphaerales bacterium]
MPTYEYLCDSCGYEFEEFQSITAKPLKKCPECGKNKIRRLIGCGAGLIFKGNGFYETDYRSESYKKAQKADQEKVKPEKTDKSVSNTSSDKNKTTSKDNSKKNKNS